MLALATAFVLWLATAAPAPGVDLGHFATHTTGSTVDVDHGDFARFLARYRVLGDDGIARVRYGAVTAADADRLDAYLARLAAVAPRALDRDEQLAFWLNLHNAAVLDVVLAHYPVETIRDIDLDPRAAVWGPWTAAAVEVAGAAVSLADIEALILRHWDDARLHYALHRGSLGCPNLPAEPFEAASIDARLDAAAMAFVDHPRAVAIAGERLVVSRLYRWFMDDFGGSERGVLRHLMAFATPARAMALQRFDGIDDYRYDWRLNDR